MEFVKYTNIAIYQYNKLNEKDAKIFNEIKNYTFIEEQINHIFNIWKIAFNFYTKNIKDLLNSINLRESYIFYQIKIVLNSMHEYLDKITKLLRKIYPIQETRVINNKQEKLKHGEWLLKDITSKIYDSSFAYAVCYNLRNYMQHDNDIGIYLYINTKKERKICIDVKTYCENHTGISKSLKDLVKNISYENQRYDLNELILKLNTDIQLIQKQVLDLLYPIIFEKAITYNLGLLFLCANYNLNKEINAIKYENESNNSKKQKICFINFDKAKTFICENLNICFKKSPLNVLNSILPPIHNDSKYKCENNLYIFNLINNQESDLFLVKNGINQFVKLTHRAYRR